MPGKFSRLKTWLFEEVVKSADLNGEFDNIINNAIPGKIDSYSTTVGQMQTQTNPGAQGSESLAPNLAGELERLRFKIKEILGQTYWYDPVALSLVETNNLINQVAGLPPNRIVSGKVVSASDAMPAFIVPGVSSASVTIEGTPTNLVYRVNGVQYTLTSDILLTGLVPAPTTNNTALVNDATINGDQFSKIRGEYESTITIGTVGSNISALLGKTAAFKIVDGVTTEYFIAYVKSATELTNVKRGYFFDGSVLPIRRNIANTGDTITLMKLTWLFIKNDFTAEAVYTNPVYSSTAPQSPSVGDYWLDMTVNQWKRFSGSGWVVSLSTLIGVCIQDGTNCVAARAFEVYANFSDLNTLAISDITTTQARIGEFGGTVNVNGSIFQFTKDDCIWDITTDLESGFTEASDTIYFLYITEQGYTKMSPIYPYQRPDFQGCLYHPHHMWRCVGVAYNDGSSNITGASIVGQNEDLIFFSQASVYGSGATNTVRFTNITTQSGGMLIPYDDSVNGSNVLVVFPGSYSMSAKLRSATTGDGISISKINSSSGAPLIGTYPTTLSSVYIGAAGTNEFFISSVDRLLPGDRIYVNRYTAGAGFPDTTEPHFVVRKIGN